MPVVNWTGVYNTNQTMNAADENHATGTITLTGATFTIQAGVTLLFDGAFQFQINNGGTLSAVGTASSLWTFRATGGATNPRRAGAWTQFLHQSNTAGSTIQYGSVQDAVTGLDCNAAAAVTLDHVEFAMCRDYGLRMRMSAGGPFTFSNIRCAYIVNASGTARGISMETGQTIVVNDYDAYRCDFARGWSLNGTCTVNRAKNVLCGNEDLVGGLATSTLSINEQFESPVLTGSGTTYDKTVSGAGMVINLTDVVSDCRGGQMSIFARGNAAEANLHLTRCDISGYIAANGAVQRSTDLVDSWLGGNALATPDNVDTTNAATASTATPTQFGGGGQTLTNNRSGAPATPNVPLTFGVPVVSNVTSNGFQIDVTSNIRASAKIEYGTATGDYDYQTSGDAEYMDPISSMRRVGWASIRTGDIQPGTSHTFIIDNLEPNTTYFFRAIGIDPLERDLTPTAEQSQATNASAGGSAFGSGLKTGGGL